MKNIPQNFAPSACQNILFDLDGTLTDPKIGITKSADYALQSFGIHTENLDNLCKFIGPPLADSFINYYGFSEADAVRAIAKYREYFSVTGIFENAVYAGIAPMLAALKAEGRNLIVATSKPTVFAVKILEHFNLAQYFTFVAGSELDGTRSKKSEVIAYALAQNNITELASAVMIGDREHDILGANEIGLACIGVLYGYGDRAEHERAGADFIVPTVGELQTLLL